MAEVRIHSRQVEMIPVGALKGYERNARTHPDSQVNQLADIIRDSGFTNPVLIDDDDVVVAGHGRLAAARKLKMAEVPCVRLSGLTPEQVKAIRISDNATGLQSGWDEALLKLELADLSVAKFDLHLTALDLFGLFGPPDPEPIDPEIVPDPLPDPVTVRGDVWTLGRHRIMCGDSLSRQDVDRLLAGAVPDLANCDPPYGISAVKGGRIGNDGTIRSYGKTRTGNAIQYGGRKAGKVHGSTKKEMIPPGTYAPIIGDDSTATAVKPGLFFRTRNA